MLCRSRRELSFFFAFQRVFTFAKIGFDTAENEPCRVCPLSAYRSPRLSWIFETLDADESNSLSVDEFIQGMMHVKSSEQARQLFETEQNMVREIRKVRTMGLNLDNEKTKQPEGMKQLTTSLQLTEVIQAALAEASAQLDSILLS